jgi:hypothetical protein
MTKQKRIAARIIKSSSANDAQSVIYALKNWSFTETKKE